MPTFLGFVLYFLINQVEDQVSVARTVGWLNAHPAPASVFTGDFEDKSALATITKEDSAGHIVISHEPFGEAVWLPGSERITATKIRFVTPDVALADLTGPVAAVAVLIREGTEWKIASLRLLASQ